MIPKKLHFIWFGTDGMIDDEQLQYVATWVRCNPDYELYFWHEGNLPRLKYHDELLRNNYANLADYYRLWVLKEHGGIYLDDDMLCFKSFDPLLENNVFFGVDHVDKQRTVINNAIIGSVPDHPFIIRLIEILEDEMPKDRGQIFGHYIVKELSKHGFKRGYSSLAQKNAKIQRINDVTIYPGEFFYPYYGKNPFTENTYTRHMYKQRYKRKKRQRK